MHSPVIVALAVIGATAGEGIPRDAFTPGQVVERVVPAEDPGRSYALYLPSSYTPDRRWPAIIAMDPRGRALLPLRLFLEVAEKLGYIVASSYDTLSDGPYESNERAVKAMLPDIRQRFSIDRSRLYLAGFSGTARAAWDFGYRLKGSVAGIIGFAGGLPVALEPVKDSSFVFFGGAGVLDFTYEEMRALDARLDPLGIPHRFVYFEGPHAWGPAEICAEAVEWIEVQAMRRGLRPRDDAWIADLHARRLERAAALEAGGDPLGAFMELRSISETFAGLRDVEVVTGRAEALGKSRTVRRLLAGQDRQTARQKAFEARLGSFIEEFRTAAAPPRLEQSLYDLQVKTLKSDAGNGKDRIVADGARRLLETILVYTSFYEPREFLDKKEPERALAMLRIAEEIEPGSPRVCYFRARASAQLGRIQEALDALECVADRGLATAKHIESDTELDPLRGEARYREIMRRLEGARPF